MTKIDLKQKLKPLYEARADTVIEIDAPALNVLSIVEQAMRDTSKKKSLDALDRVRFDSLAEGRCAQILLVGPFAEEGPAIARLHEFIDRSGRRLSGKHHEIYLSEIRRVVPAKWRTLIRQHTASGTPAMKARGRRLMAALDCRSAGTR